MSNPFSALYVKMNICNIALVMGKTIKFLILFYRHPTNRDLLKSYAWSNYEGAKVGLEVDKGKLSLIADSDPWFNGYELCVSMKKKRLQAQ
jgi:hypothetical protein